MATKMGRHIPQNMLNMQIKLQMQRCLFQNFNQGDLLFHFEGSYHSNYQQGIIWWINKIKPGLKIKSITTVMQSEWNEMTANEKNTITNYIIVIADSVAQTKDSI
jgi:hypothetical protein